MSKNRLVVFVLFALGTLGLAEVASACDQQCQVVSPPFCRRCVDTGSFTGQTCQNSGSCGCFYTQNTCGGLSASAAPAESLKFLAAPSATSTEASSTFDLGLALAGL